jgi:NAD(P)-dependent dehydrogenase (short-subunit alcohol dehydrogenase family)
MALALVTGGNRGIGLETCRQLTERNWDVLLAARDLAAGQEAVRALQQARTRPPARGTAGSVRAVQLDVTDPASVDRLARELATQGTPLAALINNAAVMHRGISESIARDTLEVNFHGAVRVTVALRELLAADGNLVMVSSGMGELAGLSHSLRERLTNPTLARDDLSAMAEETVRGVAEGNLAERGFPLNVYSISKALLNAFTRILSRELAGSEQRANAVCPGWVQTRMGGAHAPRPVTEGARGIVWAATLDCPLASSARGECPRGEFLRDCAVIPW